MLLVAFLIFAIAVLLGTVLAVLHMREGAAMPPWALGALHGLIALTGLGCLLLALGGPPRGLAQGTASFGATAAALFAVAAMIGAMLLAARRRRQRIPGLLIGLHATFAVSGFVVLAAYVLAG
jgi:hypothetical protein